MRIWSACKPFLLSAARRPPDREFENKDAIFMAVLLGTAVFGWFVAVGNIFLCETAPCFIVSYGTSNVMIKLWVCAVFVPIIFGILMYRFFTKN